MTNNKAQNIIEYILMFVAAILVFLFLLNPKSGPIKTSVENILYNTTIDNGLNAISIPTDSVVIK